MGPTLSSSHATTEGHGQEREADRQQGSKKKWVRSSDPKVSEGPLHLTLVKRLKTQGMQPDPSPVGQKTGVTHMEGSASGPTERPAVETETRAEGKTSR